MNWKQIESFNYEINELGQVRNTKRNKILSANNSGEYSSVNLSVNGKIKTRRIHRLLAIAFIPNPLNLPCINHKDGNKYNNALNNLEWCTQKHNLEHALKTGLRNSSKGTSRPAGNVKLTEIEVLEIRKLKETTNLSYLDISKKYNVGKKCIGDIITRRNWKNI